VVDGSEPMTRNESSSGRFDWLQARLDEINTKKFHVVSDSVSQPWRTALDHAPAFPPDYVEFSKRFGDARFFRVCGSHRLRVMLPAQAMADEKLGRMYWFGQHEMTRVCFREAELDGSEAVRVWTWSIAQRWKRTDLNFGEWLFQAFEKIQGSIGKREWKAIVDGPPPFTESEASVATARLQFTSSKVGVASDGKVRIMVRNQSEMTLRSISVEVVGRHRLTGEAIEGMVRVSVGDISPKTSGMVEVPCYSEFLDPASVVTRDIDPLGPEDRGVCWELRPA
jgi:hypothetical protein